LREVVGIWVLGNRVLRRIFGPNRDKVTDVRRELYVKELHNFSVWKIIIAVINSRIKDGQGM
jgi:hypothetical protein